ncbi:MAG TPA: acetate--CoA ligase family protein, partial [Acidimicrobiales bacterium]
NCATALRGYFDYHDFLARRRSPFADLGAEPSPAKAVATKVIAESRTAGRSTWSEAASGAARSEAAGGTALSEIDSAAVLDAYGVPSAAARLCRSAADAVAAADDLGYPVVLKASGGGIAHKSDAGLVRLGVATADDVAAAYDDLVVRAVAVTTAAGTAPIDGIVVAEMVRGGVETVVGLSQDAVFGPTVMVGLGGVFVEVLGDVAFRVPPFDRDEARRMLAELRGRPLLTGARGRPPADVDALVDAVMAIQCLGMELAGTVREVDINPLLVRDDGQGAVALDALVVPEPSNGGR